MSNVEDFNQWRDFDDRELGDRSPGPARVVEISGRCVKCWGPVTGRKDVGDRWVRIECQLCGCSVEGEDASREARAMQGELEANLPRARVGHGLTYREEASFVLKVLPDMDRDTKTVNCRMAASMQAGQKRGRLSRREISPGTAGYLYAQARALLSGVENLSPGMSAIGLSDFEFGEPRIGGVEVSLADASVRVSAEVPASHRKRSDRELMARMGTAVLGGMAAAFSCEVGMKAILMTRLDEAKKTHDLVTLYEALPPDSRERLEADFPEIGEVLKHNRGTYGRWRYFEQGVGEDAVVALVNTARVRGLGKAARVMVDECVVVGLTFEVEIDTTFDVVVDEGARSLSERISLKLHGGEAAIPWAEILDSGRDES